MKLVIPPLVVEENDSFKNDAFDRKSYGESLTNLISQTDDALVISLDGKWGEGKTTFVKMWRGLLSDAGIPSIYIDAFESDYVDDAFISIARSITSYIESHSEGQSKAEEFKEKAKNIGVRVLSWGAKIGIKAATLGAINASDIDALIDVKKELADGTSSVIADFIKERLGSHEKDIAAINSFKEMLSELPAQIDGNKSNRLVIIIDELDRCRPTFAVEVLEKIKHLFSVPNIAFVLVMHKSQLEEAIKCIYGQNIDAHAYLQKFITLETSLPKKTLDRYQSDLAIYSKKLLQMHEIQTWTDGNDLLECIEALSKHFDLSLRQLEKVFTNLAIFYASSKQNQLRIIGLISFLCVIKVVRPDLFGKIMSGRISYSELLQAIEIVRLDDDDDIQRELLYIMKWLEFAMLTEGEYQALKEDHTFKRDYPRSLWNYNARREMLIPFFCQKLSMFKAN